MKTPVALFVYNRLDHAIKTIDALKKANGANETDLYVFCDGAKDFESLSQKNKVVEVRQFIKSISGFNTIQIIEQSQNIGLANSIVNGLSFVLKNHSNVIVIEDDIIVGNDFLYFMNLALEKYENEPNVAGISGYSFPIGQHKSYFTRTGSCWGWATYKRVWDDFIKKRNELNLDLILNHERALFNVHKNIYADMFLQSKQGTIQSWAVEFYLYYFSQQQYFLMPGENLIANTGFDGSGHHKKRGNFLTDNNAIGNFKIKEFPIEVKEDLNVRKKIEKLYKKGFSKPSFINSFVNKIKSVLLGNEKNYY